MEPSLTVTVASDSDSEDARPDEVIEKAVKVTVKDNAESRRKPASRQRACILAEVCTLSVREKQELINSQPEAPETIDPEVNPKMTAAFKRYYMQRLAIEFSDDLDQMRNADDFNDAALPVLVKALEQGVSMFTPEEQQRLVEYQN